jgi:hypothetical protein
MKRLARAVTGALALALAFTPPDPNGPVGTSYYVETVTLLPFPLHW